MGRKWGEGVAAVVQVITEYISPRHTFEKPVLAAKLSHIPGINFISRKEDTSSSSAFIYLDFHFTSQVLRTQAGRRVLFIGPPNFIQ